MNVICGQRLKASVKPYLFAVLLGIGILAIDQLTKFLTYQYIPRMEQATYAYPYGGIGIFKNVLGIEFAINYMTNKGAAWGVLGDYQFFLVCARMFLIAALIIYFCFYNRQPSWRIPFMLVIAGAIGNVIDFFIYGHVIDMLHFILWGYDFPVFNIADSAISIGIGSLLFLSWLKP